MVYGCRKHDLSYVYRKGIQSAMVEKAAKGIAAAGEAGEESEKEAGCSRLGMCEIRSDEY